MPTNQPNTAPHAPCVLAVLIADYFEQLIREELSESEYADAVALNRDETDPAICHTHDFCDANLVMSEAFTKATGREVDLQSAADCTLWASAWTDWKSRDVVTDDERSNGPRR